VDGEAALGAVLRRLEVDPDCPLAYLSETV
jgi:hypothetical protein